MHVISVLVVDYTYWLLFTRLVCLLHAVNSGVQFDLLDHCKLYTLMTINFFTLCRSINTIHSLIFL